MAMAMEHRFINERKHGDRDEGERAVTLQMPIEAELGRGNGQEAAKTRNHWEVGHDNASDAHRGSGYTFDVVATVQNCRGNHHPVERRDPFSPAAADSHLAAWRVSVRPARRCFRFFMMPDRVLLCAGDA
jgi:hypothetical protein